jgi:hypothetical protein
VVNVSVNLTLNQKQKTPPTVGAWIYSTQFQHILAYLTKLFNWFTKRINDALLI